MKNIHILPTDKPSKIFYSGNNPKLLFSKYPTLFKTFERSPHNIYITSDEEIKKDEYYLGEDNNIYCLVTTVNFNGKKIILTTDQDLIKDGVQAIYDNFLEWFVKNPSCEEVEVEIESKFDRVDGHYHDVWEIIIPKEEPNGCIGSNGVSDPTLNEVQLNQPKQETLEEAAERTEFERYGKTLTNYTKQRPAYNLGFQQGAKWQQERSYNDEDLRIAFVEGHNSARLRGSYKFNGTFEEDWILWFEKFKKK